MSWHAASMVSLRWPTTVHPALSAKAFNFSRCSMLMHVLVLLDLWFPRRRSATFREMAMELWSCVPHDPPFSFGPPAAPSSQGCSDKGGGNETARFSTVLTGLTSDESGPS
jgi:hypothetical protein